MLRQWLAKLAKALPRARTKPGKPQQHRAFDGSEEAIRRRKSSANRTWTILRAALNHAFRDDLVASDAAWRKVKPFKGVDAARVRYLTVAEARRLINASDPEFRPLVQAALQTGCRYGELARLEVADFNPDSGTLAIRQSKSGKARHVVLTDEGVSFFRQLTAGRAGSEIMLRKANGEAWRASHQLRPMAQACQRAKINPPVSFHALAAHLGKPRRHERRAAARRGEEPGSRRHAHGRKALRALGAQLYRRRHPCGCAEIRVQARPDSYAAAGIGRWRSAGVRLEARG